MEPFKFHKNTTLHIKPKKANTWGTVEGCACVLGEGGEKKEEGVFLKILEKFGGVFLTVLSILIIWVSLSF